MFAMHIFLQAREYLKDVALPPSLEGVLDELVKENNLRLLKYKRRLGLVVQTYTEVRVKVHAQEL
jgi:hypothetical protein